MLENIFSVSLFLLGLGFSFFIPGFCLIETFLTELTFRIKLPLYLILSLLISTYLVYFASLLLGFSRATILLCCLLPLPWFFYCMKKKGDNLKESIRKSRWQIISGMVVYLLFFLALFPGIFTLLKGQVVMSSVNWQDTAMHMEIIQSLSQGNFPPQAPYYAGVPLTYYYFTDFHSAILVTLYGQFFPRVLVWDNPFFAAIFGMSIYALTYELTRKRNLSVTASFAATLFGGYIFIRFFADIVNINNQASIIGEIIGLLLVHTYSMEYEQLFQMANMADYFLQNRPMMVGLPAVTAVLVLTLYAFRKKNLKTVLLAGVISGLLIRFQFFAVLVSIIIFGMGLLFYFRKSKIRFYLNSLVIFLLPILVSLLLFSAQTKVGETSLVSLVRENFSFGPWEKGKDIMWHLQFIGMNFGLPFGLTVLTFIWLFWRAVTKKEILKEVFFLSTLSLIFFAIPYILRFTIYKGDMFKFFYFMAPLSLIVSFWIVNTAIKKKTIQKIILALIFFSSVFSSLLTLANSALNKNIAYSDEELKAGLWIRENTPKNSVFISLPTVHAPTSQIGGRLRVLSYINWPYSHGYNVGEDNVFARLRDVESVYFSGGREEVIKTAMKYKADYIYYGSEERAKAPQAEEFFDSLGFLKRVYSSEGITIYEI